LEICHKDATTKYISVQFGERYKGEGL